MEHPFFSRTCGTGQWLPGGNLLITESDNGRVFELDSAQKTVWEFYNPNRAGAADKFNATLFEVLRLPSEFSVKWAIAPDRSRFGPTWAEICGPKTYQSTGRFTKHAVDVI